jgi:hypothetical protein
MRPGHLAPVLVPVCHPMGVPPGITPVLHREDRLGEMRGCRGQNSSQTWRSGFQILLPCDVIPLCDAVLYICLEIQPFRVSLQRVLGLLNLVRQPWSDVVDRNGAGWGKCLPCLLLFPSRTWAWPPGFQTELLWGPQSSWHVYRTSSEALFVFCLSPIN